MQPPSTNRQLLGQFDRATPRAAGPAARFDMDQVATSRQRNDPHLPRVVLGGPRFDRECQKLTIQAGRSTMKAGAAPKKEADAGDCWKGFQHGAWLDSIDVRDFIVRNVTPYTSDEDFLAGPSPRTKAVWAKLQPYFADERKKGVLAVDAQSPSTMLAHKAGYIDRDNEVIVGLQTDQPFKRAIFPFGGLRMVETGLKAAGFDPDPRVHEAFTKYRKSHNDGVFDAYTPEIMNCRRSGIITGLPDAYGRGRIIGDYRRVALYGVDRLLESKRAERAQLDDMWATEDVIRLREELAEQMRALRDLAAMGKRYDCDISKPASNA